MYDNILMANKKDQWIEGTTARWDGYTEFQRRPDLSFVKIQSVVSGLSPSR